MDWLAANPWVAWLCIAGVLAVSEMLTLDLTLLMLATGALAAGGVALVFPGLVWLQVVAAVAVALTAQAGVRPFLLQRLKSSPGYRSSTDKLLGNSGTARGEIDATRGEVKLDGEIWSARSYDGSVIASGTTVDVMEVDGVTLVVFPSHKPLSA